MGDFERGMNALSIAHLFRDVTADRKRMRYKALLLDFYGTLVEEDDSAISEVLKAIAETSPLSSDTKQIGRDWQLRFQRLCSMAYAENFKTQRAIEIESLADLLTAYQANLDPKSLTECLFAYWQAPRVLAESAEFVKSNSLPVCIVSNTDTDDLQTALRNVGWQFDHLVTSERCRSYKPRPEMFQRALDDLQCNANEVLHIGDSLTSDVFGAQQLGIDTVWVNRKNKALPSNVPMPTFTIANLRELLLRLPGPWRSTW
jgi:2-haloacid dehalogenase/putative hydrolase of the HAD superfamily